LQSASSPSLHCYSPRCSVTTSLCETIVNESQNRIVSNRAPEMLRTSFSSGVPAFDNLPDVAASSCQLEAKNATLGALAVPVDLISH